MKTILIITMAFLTLPALAGEDIGVEGSKGPAIERLISLWQLLIPIIVPAAIAGLKALIPQLPKRFIPILAPIIGAVIDLILNATGLGYGVGAVGAVLGSAGVGIREIVNEQKKEIYQ